jgi:GTPase SAR1 family protein
MTQIENKELDLAHRYVNETNSHIFLTGKAGTGKTTFLKELRKNTKKRNIVVAPTGVAAINAGGMTIHSFFQLAFGLLLPEHIRKTSSPRKLKKSKVNIIRSLDLIIIDEVSMVRADIMDAIDTVLKKYRRSKEPFGGVQMLMIGDMHQLPPVLKSQDRQAMQEHYPTHYFFGSVVIRNSKMIMIELKHIYRQSDSSFLNILNQVRNNNISAETLSLLNTRYEPDYQDDGKTVTLTSLRRSSDVINQNKLNNLKTEPQEYKAEIEGVFNPSQYPTEENLVLKVGVRVMFIKNDLAEKKQYYNGKMGIITEANKYYVKVLCDDKLELEISPTEWQNTSYELDKATKVIEEKVIGSFTQYPLKLAWAVTIHKSQGLTFDKVIIDAQNAFEHGQVYVALSRCKSLDGIYLKSRIDKSVIKNDTTIDSFEQKAKEKPLNEETLLEAKIDFEQYLLKEIYDFTTIQNMHNALVYILEDHKSKLHGNAVEKSYMSGSAIATKANAPALKFVKILANEFLKKQSITENQILMDRIKSSAVYFDKIIIDDIQSHYKSIEIITENSAVKEKLEEKIENLKKELHLKSMVFKALKDGFASHKIISARSNAEIDYADSSKSRSHSKTKIRVASEVVHKDLYKKLGQWRADIATEREIEPYMIFPIASMIELTFVLPRNEKILLAVAGMGKQRVKLYGSEIIELIDQYCKSNKLEGNHLDKSSKKVKVKKNSPPKGQTVITSLELYKQHKDLQKVAELRELALSTIEGHMSQLIEKGDLDISEFMTAEKRDKAVSYFNKTESKDLKSAVTSLNNEYSYGQLRMIRASMEKKEDGS